MKLRARSSALTTAAPITGPTAVATPESDRDAAHFVNDVDNALDVLF
ncbi:hypothetical protein [Streptomyces sp. NRRL WC-3742]|nr:hypothetical protein [Streptomyces sp. NRRL WC-3742]